MDSFSQSVSSVAQLCLTLCNPMAACQASLSITNSQSLLKLMSIELAMPSSHLILCRPLLLPTSTFPSIRIFSNESVLRIRWSKYWSFSFSISPSNEYSGLISFRMDWSDLLAVQPWHKPNRTGENGMACFKAKQKQTDGFLQWVSGPQLFWLLEADGTQDWGGWWAGARNHVPSCGLQDLSLIKPRARRPSIPGDLIKTTEGYLE